MKNAVSLVAFLILFVLNANAQPLHTLKMKNEKRLQKFFQHKGKNIPVISGHRGATAEGIPENSIEAMEYVLRHTPAFFEIDPRLTKDSVIVLMHDATIDRTTNGTGKLSDYTWEELKQFKLKDHLGNITNYRIPSLAEAIEWARGKTILNLDRKDVPLQMTADIIRKHNAGAFVMVTVHSADQAKFYLDDDKRRMMSAFIRTEDQYKEYLEAEIPWKNLIAYIGADKDKDTGKLLREKLHKHGVMCMISAASTYDKNKDSILRFEAYRDIIRQGTDILESDYPVSVAEALK